jgi:hypothetical protein
MRPTHRITNFIFSWLILNVTHIYKTPPQQPASDQVKGHDSVVKLNQCLKCIFHFLLMDTWLLAHIVSLGIDTRPGLVWPAIGSTNAGVQLLPYPRPGSDLRIKVQWWVVEQKAGRSLVLSLGLEDSTPGLGNSSQMFLSKQE